MTKITTDKEWAFISNMYPSLDSPSYGAFIQRSFEDLLQHGFHITRFYVIAGRKKRIAKLAAYIIHLAKLCVLLFRADVGNIYLHYASHHCLPIAFAAKFLKKNVIVNIHGDDLIITDSARRKLMMLGQATLFEYAKLIIVPSLFFKENFFRLYPTISEQKIVISPSSGIMARGFADGASQRVTYWCDMSDGAIPTIAEFGYVGRIEADKGWEILVDSFIELSRSISQPIRLTLWGEGNEVSRLQEKLSNAPGGLIQYLGGVAPAEVINIHKNFDFHVVPSFRESLGLSALEGMAAGHVVICSRIRPFTDIAIDGKHAVFFSAGDVNSLKDVMVNTLFLSRQVLRTISASAMQLASSFDRNLVSQDLANSIRKAIDGNN